MLLEFLILSFVCNVATSTSVTADVNVTTGALVNTTSNDADPNVTTTTPFTTMATTTPQPMSTSVPAEVNVTTSALVNTTSNDADPNVITTTPFTTMASTTPQPICEYASNTCHGVLCLGKQRCQMVPSKCAYRCKTKKKYCLRRYCKHIDYCKFSSKNTCAKYGHKCVKSCQDCVVECEISRWNATIPKHPRVISQDYRRMKIGWDEPAGINSNTSSNSSKLYKFRYVIQKPTRYKDIIGYFLRSGPIATLDGLLANTFVKIRVALNEMSNAPYFEYSLDHDFNTKSVAKIRNLDLPGKVRDITARLAGGKQVIEWKTPLNILDSTSSKEVQSIQYEVTRCYYKPLMKEESNCKIIADVVGNLSNSVQSTLQMENSIYKPKIDDVPTNRDYLIKITSIALNLDRGETNSAMVRLDPESVPETPRNLQLYSSTTSDDVILSWKKNTLHNGTIRYLVRYKEVGGIYKDVFTAINSLKLLDISVDKVYEVKVGISECVNGSSLFSESIYIRNRALIRPTSTDGNISTMLTAQFPIIAFLNVAVVLFCWYVL